MYPFINKNVFLNFLFLILSFALNFFHPLFYWTTILLFVISLYDFKFNKVHFNELFLLMLSFYLFHVFSFFYSKDKNEALFDLQVKLSLLAFPIIGSCIGNYLNIKKIYLFYIFFSVMLSVFLIIRVLYYYFQNHHLLSYNDFSYFFHPSYLAMYQNTALALLLFNKELQMRRFMKVIVYILLSVSILFSASKAGIFVLFIVFLVYFLYIKKNIIHWILFFLFLLLVYFLFKFGKIYATSITDRFITQYEIVLKILNKQDVPIETNSIRVYAWIASIQNIKNNFLLGVGIGDTQSYLNDFYKNSGLSVLAEKNINSHNQFLQSFLALGILGGVLIIWFFIKLLMLSFQKKLMHIFVIGIIVLFNFLFESMLETSSGNIFCGFIFCLNFMELYKTNNYDI